MRNKKNRFIYMFIAGIAITFLMHSIIPFPVHKHPFIYDFIITIAITFLVWEGNLRIDSWLNIRFPWVKNVGKRIFVHSIFAAVYSTLAIHIPNAAYSHYVCNMPEDQKTNLMISSIVIGLLISFVILSIEISTQFFRQWKQSMLEVERYKTESVEAQLQNLKNQINPHFLFNNMSVLSSLVYKDQDKAVDFINQLSKVYRYLLDNRNNELVTLENEMEFIKSYNYLLQIRFDTNIIFKTEIRSDKMVMLIPPMAIQMLIENAIKHNEISTEMPLTISIENEDNKIVVSNNLQLRNNPEISSKSGLQNIKDRYQFYTSEMVEVNQEQKKFIVKLPLLRSK
jgi:two-component system LytT family sensor kinase